MSIKRILYPLMGGVLITSLSGCVVSPESAALGRVVVNEVASACNAVVGEDVGRRIDEEWAKYPEAQVSRPVIESVSKVILTMPGMTDEQKMQAYQSYMSCVTGVYLSRQ